MNGTPPLRPNRTRISPTRQWGRWVVGGVVVLAGITAIALKTTSFVPLPLAVRPGSEVVTTSGQVLRGSRLFDILQSAALTADQSQAVVEALSKNLNPRTLNESDRYEIQRSSPGGDFRRLTITRKWERFVVDAPPAAEGAGPLISRKETIPLTPTDKTASGVLADSLWATLIGQGLDPSVIVELADIFAWNIDFLTETRDGDRFALSWRESRTPEGRLASVQILAAVYTGRAAGDHSAILFNNEYYDGEGATLRKAFLHAPLNFRRISSGFTHRRFHPILRQWRPHHGIDYAAPTGTPVVSVGEGTVFYRGFSGGLGKVVKVRHNGTYSTYYGHLSRFAAGISVGTRVKQGQLVGYVGSTGLSTGPHLHFEVIKNGSTVNFLTLKMPSVGSVPREQKKSFEEIRDRVLPPLLAKTR